MDLTAAKQAVSAKVNELKANGNLCMRSTKDLAGKDVALEKITFDPNLGFFYEFIACQKSAKYNLGTCDCSSHPSEQKQRIPPEVVLSKLSFAVRQEFLDAETPEKKKQRVQNELDRLDSLVSKMDDSGSGPAPRSEKKKKERPRP